MIIFDWHITNRAYSTTFTDLIEPVEENKEIKIIYFINNQHRNGPFQTVSCTWITFMPIDWQLHVADQKCCLLILAE